MYKYVPNFAFRHETEPYPHVEETELKVPSYAMLSYITVFWSGGVKVRYIEVTKEGSLPLSVLTWLNFGHRFSVCVFLAINHDSCAGPQIS